MPCASMNDDFHKQSPWYSTVLLPKPHPTPPKKKEHTVAFWPTNLDILARVCSLRPIWAKDPLKPREPRIGRRTSESVWPSWWRKANFHRSLDLFPCKPWSLGEPMQQIQYLHYHIWAQFFVGSYYYVIIFASFCNHSTVQEMWYIFVS